MQLKSAAYFYTIEIIKTQVASAGGMLGGNCVVYAAVGAGGMLFGHCFRHISLAPLRITFRRECSAQKINRHSITFTFIYLLCLNSTDKSKVVLLFSYVHLFNISI